MRYRASNGITASTVLTEHEARADYEAAAYVSGAFGERFVICPLGEYGRLLTCAATEYTPVKEPSARRRTRRRSTRPPTAR